MIHSIKIIIPDSIDNEKLYISIESIFTQNNFIIGRDGDKLNFERKASKRGPQKFQILIELFKAFTTGIIYVDNVSPRKLICKIYYFKQLIISFVIGFLISSIFSIYLGRFFALLIQLGLPFTLMFLIIGIMTGNSQIDDLLKKAIK